MAWFGLGKNRSKFGKWLDKRGISQQEVADSSGVSKSTVARLCSDNDAKPNFRNRKKLRDALRRFDGDFNDRDFWGM